MNINRDYLIINDVKKSNIQLANDSMFFYITDKNTQNIFVNLVINVSKNDLIQKYANIENAEDYTLTMNIVKPDNTYKIIEGKLHDKEKAIFEFDLKEDCVDKIGTYKCELLTKCNINDHEEITTSNKLTYKVKSSILNNLDDIVNAPEYPLVIQLFDKLSDIEQYEEDRRANELARQLAEEQRQQRFNELDADMTDRVTAMDDKMVDVENRVSAKEQAVDKLINDTKADIDDYKVAKDQEIDDYKTAKDQQINEAITAQDNKIDEAISNQNDRIAVVENNVVAQNSKLDVLETKATTHEARITVVEAKNTEQDNRLDIAENRLNNIGNDITNTMQPIIDAHTSRLDAIEAVNVSQDNRLDAIEIKNQQQDDRLLDVEKVNKRQDMDLKCLFAESKNNMIDVTEEGNSIYLQNSTVGYTLIDEIQGNTMVNCNKEPDKEIILNGNINTEGYSNVTLTEGVDGGLVDVALEGNTMVNVCDQKDPVAITKSYTVETGNHVALQGEYDGKCRPVVTGNTLWIDNDTEDVLTAFDESKNLRLQSSFEDKVVTQEMVDAGEELAENLGKYKVDYVISREDGTVGQTKTFYLNSPLLEGDTIEQQGDNVVHVHRSELRAYETDDELTLPTDMTNTLVAKATPQYEVISQNDTILCDSYINGHLDVDSVIPIKKVTFDLTSTAKVKYLYASTDYILQFESDNIGKVYNWNINNNYFNGFNVVKGINKVYFTTGDTVYTSHLFANINGIGFNASNIVVTEATDQDFGYFEGMKSVGECEDLEVVSSNKNLLDFNKFINAKLTTFNGIECIEIQDTGKYFRYYDNFKPNTQYTFTLKMYREESHVNRIFDFWIYYTDGTARNMALKHDILKSYTTEAGKTIDFITGEWKYGGKGYIDLTVSQIGEGKTATDYIPHAHNTQTLTHEPLRSVGDIKDKYVLIDGKWYIERNCAEVVLDGSDDEEYIMSNELDSTVRFTKDKDPSYRVPTNGICDKLISFSNIGSYNHDVENIRVENDSQLYIRINKSKLTDISSAGFKTWLQSNPLTIVTALKTPQYEPIEYNPFEVYSDITHISNNSTIPCNMTIKNTGYNCLLKPSTTYTVSSNLGLNTVTTPSVLTEDCLRFYDTDTSNVTTMRNVMVLEGDYTTGKPLPSHFSGIESAFEQEYDEAVGKYKVKIRVQNEDASKENYIEFYIDEPLRGIGDIKDKVYVKNDKVVVERNCGSVTLDGSELWFNHTSTDNTIKYYAYISDVKSNNIEDIVNCVSNKFAGKSYNKYKLDYEGITLNNSSGKMMLISISKSKLQTQDVNGFKQWLQQNPTTVVYQLAEPTYEEVEYNDVKLFIESFKNSTLFYNSNIPVTSTVHYSYSVPLVDTVAQTASISDEQDRLLVNMATEIAIMQMTM